MNADISRPAPHGCEFIAHLVLPDAHVGNLLPHLPQITAPVLAIAGKNDSTIPAAKTVIIGERIPHGTTVLLNGLDHALYMEQPEKIAQCMMEWLDNVLSSSP